jgi:hypothetical protein
MKTRTEILKVVHYASSAVPDIETTEKVFAPTIEWGDKNPLAWRVVQESKSLAWGKGSSHYYGAAQGSGAPLAVLSRMQSFREVLTRKVPKERAADDFFRWSAQFTLDHYKDKDFRGGFLQQYDGQHTRGCAYVDYTPATLDTVVKHFRAWCDAGPNKHETKAVWLNKIPVWQGCDHTGPKSRRPTDGALVCDACGKDVRL